MEPATVFEVDWRLQPEAFFDLVGKTEMFWGRPGVVHYFVKMLGELKILFAAVTENIDGLEQRTGMDMDKVIFANGKLRGGHCGKCMTEATKNKW